ncbi:MAG: radical SAM protein [Elusimicrobiota bacterium]|nr:radical SAM protein [Elusimicrobiota bacterium]
MLDVFLNYACQAKCPFCYNPPLTPELTAWKLPLDRLAHELLEGHKKGFRGVTFSGGEVTLLAELPTMLRLARKAGYSSIGVISNGIRMAEESYTRELADSGLSFACLSIHAGEPALHDELLGVPGAFDKAARALDRLEALKIPAVLNFVITRRNVAAMPAFIERFAARPGVVEFQLYFPHYEGLMTVHADALKLPVGDVVPALTAAFARAQALGAQDKVFVYNMPPCSLPSIPRERLRNWEEESASLLIDPKGVEDGRFQNERRGRYKNEKCRSCALDARCLGYENGYVERYGDADLRPVKGT